MLSDVVKDYYWVRKRRFRWVTRKWVRKRIKKILVYLFIFREIKKIIFK